MPEDLLLDLLPQTCSHKVIINILTFFIKKQNLKIYINWNNKEYLKLKILILFFNNTFFFIASGLCHLRATLVNTLPEPVGSKKHPNLHCFKMIIRLRNNKWYYHYQWRSFVSELSFISLWIRIYRCPNRIHPCLDSWRLFLW